ncbi:fungal-specific transcription factor domain-containing protein [Mycena alexandri]|uniref:Fungal-specific transcription factor domain-containing protein n=1 Tax=Mycena alexandri TaxID=1745969 RepID=A0AAD6XDF5_9AGAR|nr:fungal-specific transcription factor domain-containing protein [Mycena alexandri]
MSFDATCLQPTDSQPRKPKRSSCDGCRRRKIRCGPPIPEGRCPNCLASGTLCTFSPRVKNARAEHSAIEELRKENAALKAKLRSLSVCSLCAQPLFPTPLDDGPTNSASMFHHISLETETTTKKPLKDESIVDELTSRFSQFALDSQKNKYFGSGGGYALANEAMAMKEKYLGRPFISRTRRPVYWDVLPWEKEGFSLEPNYVYPPSDLMVSLLQLYFNFVHPTFPVLHRPSFGRAYGEGLHFTNMKFGGLLLAVLAVASKYSDDPRVFVEGDTSLSAGWTFANQVQVVQKVFRPTLHEAQTCCLLTFFALGTSLPQNAWVYLGLGSRFLQQRGQHQRKREDGKFNFEDELWKRVFWSFAAMDKMVSLFVGRPSAFLLDYDVDLPLAVDDEYWDRGFIQPLGRPSLHSYFVHLGRLFEILGDAMARLHGSKKMKLMHGWNGPEWEQRTLADLDSAMNDLFNSIPVHLRWDPDSPTQDVFFDQSATYNVLYHYVQIAIHRPHIYKPSGLGAPSLSICARSARTILHTADIWFKKQQRTPLPDLINPVFLAGVLLVLIVFGTKRAGLSESIDTGKDLVQVETAMEILKSAQSRWQPAGRLLEILVELRSLDPLSANDPLNDERDPTSAQPTVPGPSPSSILDFYYAQHGETFAPAEQPWDDAIFSMSIEQLLADTNSSDPMNNILANELTFMWASPGVPNDLAYVGQ